MRSAVVGFTPCAREVLRITWKNSRQSGGSAARCSWALGRRAGGTKGNQTRGERFCTPLTWRYT